MDAVDMRDGIPEVFCITAPCRRERFDWEGKISTVLFYGDASSLVFLLAKPFIWEEEDEPETMNLAQKASRLGVEPQAIEYQPRSPILEMPHEIYGCIFETLDVQSIFNFGLTCQELWPVAKYFIKSRFKKVLGIWAGVPLICPGCDHPKGENSYPTGVLSSSAEEELKKGLRVGEPGFSGQMFHIPGHEEIVNRYYKTNLFRLAIKRYRMLPLVDDAVQTMIEVSETTGPYRPKDMFRIVRPTPAMFYPLNEKWILRNLTTRQFVRAEAIALKPEYIQGPLIKILGFGEVIISKTCWSDHGDTWVNYPVNKGPWAGHSFDVVPLSKLKDGGIWEDISLNIAAELRRMCRLQYGDDWFEKLIHRFERKCMDPWGRWREETLWETFQRQAKQSSQGFFGFFRKKN
ncbi:hypothetical protein CIRG_08667 [Coccidioides immitis RMSCC 2394]|uniref:F-box domain-containing protein n=1 Tax=Coccidioides immitis RMSCC 2394 TaxID=404692 RepID=A0A0J6YK05_COCIT|nr:hypothetical protein CIRG_08667 [Coccidioides immitis RMSCC 2394]